ncbi:hypothetical protein [Streptomyces sp. NBC_01727]|uniref:hypothetical protein n=1 Tax=Streptomyces sp. NBC_01727 TaxID=2975924 RepID=UPI002E115618|nr:hypothetical protein OIE76_36575 [Streptomyces sp. NBC_01727]
MNRTTEQETVARLWQEHRDAAFPAGLRRTELAEGIHMVPLDLDIAMNVSSWLDHGDSFHAERRRVLSKCLADIDQVLPLITEAEELSYCQRLRQMAQLLFEAGPQPTK